ncbi:MipA/OmpV family protein [Lacisediminimonas profundi]|uniref:MipA/OmpV family protein n=1 Tax=Lacisediminimonas profundi TaxID=2603856 RepID=UPI00124B6FA4|nr:MipA/OmpV family protein [Lacisediminimonas profundi]
MTKLFAVRRLQILRRALWLSLLAIPCAHAGTFPLWEAGVGIGVLSLPDYRGADQRGQTVLPLPYLVYRGEWLKADRDGIRTMLFQSERIELNISALGTLPVTSRNNNARRGMADLRPTVELGPTLNIHLRPPDSRSTLQLRFPLRAAIALDTPLRHVGWVFAPSLGWQGRELPGMAGWNLSVSGGPQFQDRRYNETFYSVASSEVLPSRPAYAARAGYAGSQVTVTLTRRFPNFWVGAFARYDYLGGAAFEDSPLMRSRNSLAAGFGVSWVFGQSRTMVEANE